MARMELLAPRSLGGVYDRGFDVFRRNLAYILLTTAVVLVPVQLILTVLSDLWLNPQLIRVQAEAANADAVGLFWVVCGGALIGLPADGVPGLISLFAVVVASA